MLHQRYRRSAHSRRFLARSSYYYAALGALAIFAVCALFISLPGTDRRRLPPAEEGRGDTISSVPHSDGEGEQVITERQDSPPSSPPGFDDSLSDDYDQDQIEADEAIAILDDLQWAEIQELHTKIGKLVAKIDKIDKELCSRTTLEKATSSSDRKTEELIILSASNELREVWSRAKLIEDEHFSNFPPAPDVLRAHKAALEKRDKAVVEILAEVMNGYLMSESESPPALPKNESDVTGPPVGCSSCVIL